MERGGGEEPKWRRGEALRDVTLCEMAARDRGAASSPGVGDDAAPVHSPVATSHALGFRRSQLQARRGRVLRLLECVLLLFHMA